ncbi:putative polygalacturonase [Lupinus albus]|uniref:Putative polygalacturonase n=1 Tax=Lupinus albus TaxID=3870 RepID=A0A6A4Q0I5_LUPAL|nr:putative polygalacturonase [Lupinus albus]
MANPTPNHCLFHLLILMIILSDSATAFLSAWSKACVSAKPAEIHVPQGKFKIAGHVIFKGPCANKAISITIDGELTLGFSHSKNIGISRLTSINSQHFHIVFNGCENVKIEGVKIIADGNSPNTDGIHVQMSSNIIILKSKIRTGDDCISIGPGTRNLHIENIECGPGHGISIGSLGWTRNEPGVQNVTVRTVTLTGTQYDVRIKSWGRPSSGFVKEVLFKNATMTDVQNPILIDQNYCPNNKNCPGQASGVKISDVRYEDIHGTSATQVAMKFDCSSTNPCIGIKLENVKLTYKNQVAEASCKNVGLNMESVQPQHCS